MGERQFTSRGPFAVTESDCKHAPRRLRINAVADDRGFVALKASGSDDEHSSRRRARDRCIAGAVRESVQLEVGVEVQQRCFQRQSISRSRAIQCLPTFARMTGSKRRRTHIARRGRSMGATVRSCHAAPMQSRKQASAGSTRDEWFATKGTPAPTDADDRFDDSRHLRRTLASNGKQASAIWAVVRGSRRASRTCAFCERARQHLGAGRTLSALAFAQEQARVGLLARYCFARSAVAELTMPMATIGSRRSRRAGAGRMIAFAAPDRRTRRRARLGNATDAIASSMAFPAVRPTHR